MAAPFNRLDVSDEFDGFCMSLQGVVLPTAWRCRAAEHPAVTDLWFRVLELGDL